MAEEKKPEKPEVEPTQGADERQDVTAGKGRRDEVGHTGIYPASGPQAEGDAEVRTPGELGHPRRDRDAHRDS